MHTIVVIHNRINYENKPMSECKTCFKDSKEHSRNLWQLHQEAKPCLLCNKNSGKHSEKLWEMHQTVLALGSHGEKLRPISMGFGSTTIARVHKWNTIKVNGKDSPYHIELIPIHMRCTGCKNAMSANEVDVADVLDGLCLECFSEQTDQEYTWHSKPWWAVNNGKYSNE
tara:strand:- start:137 stop:646 length:510 start_codon:yes stop_codon:yes gene_type:complete